MSDRKLMSYLEKFRNISLPVINLRNCLKGLINHIFNMFVGVFFFFSIMMAPEKKMTFLSYVELDRNDII